MDIVRSTRSFWNFKGDFNTFVDDKDREKAYNLIRPINGPKIGYKFLRGFYGPRYKAEDRCPNPKGFGLKVGLGVKLGYRTSA